MHAFALGGFAPVALRLYPEALKRPPSAYTDLIPAALPGAPESPAEQVRLIPKPYRRSWSARAMELELLRPWTRAGVVPRWPLLINALAQYTLTAAR